MKILKKIILAVGIIGVALAIFFSARNKTPSQSLKKETLFPKFAVFSDIHSDLTNLKKALEFTQADNLDFVIITGDLTTLGKKSELLEIKNILNNSGITYYAIPGNHDLWFSRQIKANVWKEVFGVDYQSFTSQNRKFILINNGEDYAGISDEQWWWLTNELKDCPKITCLVFMHEPLNHPSSTHIMGEQKALIASQAANLVKMLVNSQVKEVFAGHLHYSSVYQLNGLTTTIIGAISTDRNPQKPHFLEIFSLEQRKEIVVTD